MEIQIDWDNPQEERDLTLGRWQDLETLVELLNEAWNGEISYELRPVNGQPDAWLFVEDYDADDEYECGLVNKVGKSAVALSSAVYDLVMGAYWKYQNEVGGEMAA